MLNHGRFAGSFETKILRTYNGRSKGEDEILNAFLEVQNFIRPSPRHRTGDFESIARQTYIGYL